PGGLARTATRPAEVVAAQQQRLVPLISGTVKEVSVDIGDRVKKGQVLIVLDAPLLAQEVEQATANLEMAQAQMEEVEAQVRIAETEVDSAGMELKRYKASAEAVGIGKLAAAETNVRVKKGKLLHAKATLHASKANVKARQVAVAKARIQESFTRITAAFDGVVTRRTADPGNFFQPSDSRLLTPLLTLQRTDQVRIVVRLPSGYAALVERGDPVALTIESLPGVAITGQKIARFSPTINPDNRTMAVEIEVANLTDSCARN